jgi:hypothetical protein
VSDREELASKRLHQLEAAERAPVVVDDRERGVIDAETRVVEENLIFERRREALVPKEEPVDVRVLLETGGERRRNRPQSRFTKLVVIDTLDGVDERRFELLPDPAREKRGGALTDLL